MTSILYRERVLPSKGTFLLPVVLAILVYALSLPAGVPIAAASSVLAAAILTALLIAKAPVIEVTAEKLRVGRAVIERKFLADIEQIEEERAFAERGHLLDARAFTCFQSSVRTMAKVKIADKSDPTPYWLFSTRNAEALVQLLRD